MAEVPSPEVTQSQDVSRDADATRAPDPDATRAPDSVLVGGAQGGTTEKLGGPDAGQISGQLKAWGDFQLLQVLGRGGFGEVYRAWDPVLEREVALKLLLPRGMDPELEFTTMVAEARAMAKVHHPNIVPVYGVDRREGRVGFWSEFVRGQTLNALIAAQGVMDERNAAATVGALCDALGAVHAAGLLHRDIKPGNAMRDQSGRVLLMDFGLSQNLLAGTGWSGTPAYMAPEVAAGNAATAQSDLYSMGVLLRFLTTGSVAPVTAVPQQLAGIVKRATETDARLRYASAAQMGAELAAVLQIKPEPDKRDKKAKKEKEEKEKGFWGFARKWVWVAIGLTFVFGTQMWTKVKQVGVSVVHPGYQDYLDANEALARYDKPGYTEKAIDLYLSALKSEPKDALAEAGLARAYWRKYEDTSEARWADEANAASAKAMTMNASLAAVQMTSGMIHAAQGKSDIGIEELEKAANLDPKSADAHGLLANAYRKQGRTEDARKEFQQAMDLDDENWRWPYLMGAMQIDTGDFTGAEKSLKDALEKTSENARVLYNLGLVYLKEARLDEAQKALQKSVDLDPRADPIMALGQVFYRKSDFASAIATYKRATDVAPNQFDSWGNLAEAYAADGKHETEAAEAFKKAVVLAEEEKKRTPDDAYTISMLGKYYASLHETERALPLLRKSIALAPKDPDTAESVAEAYEVLGMRKEALEFLTKALQLGYPVNYARASPTFHSLRSDPNAPLVMGDNYSMKITGGKK
ncbi:serine/threonine-protein kinase [Terracidiphilus gabretensis]|uniref:serine/threonine-protein kinase n=1 Tax=Terracidiphilus gabretensis TaxID=1577687 RepID=UPI00071B7368|nr:serine/threonine-protein kinase [Terracidiphilus gabretensis]